MIVIYFLIPLSIIVAAGFLALFIWAVRSGQYEDTCTPSMRLLMEEKRKREVDGADDKKCDSNPADNQIRTTDD
jgi:cbb3-type cytochrome oxidase maturation protein